MFPFLIGTVRTKNFLFSFISPWKVSIPHRYGKNARIVVSDEMKRREVSIPHRYGKNFNLHYLKNITSVKFPFLIGTVRTET